MFKKKRDKDKVEHKEVHVVDETSPSGDDQSPWGNFRVPSASPERFKVAYSKSIIWLGVGGILLVPAYVLGIAFVAFWATMLVKRFKDPLHIAGGVVAPLVGAAASLMLFGLGLESMLSVCVYVAVAFVLATLVLKNKATITSDYMVAAFSGVALFGAWALVQLLSGSSIEGAVGSVLQEINTAIGQVGGQELQAQLRAVLPNLALLLPLGFFLIAGAGVLGAHFGARMASPKTGRSMWKLEKVDAPAWSMVTLIVGILCIACGGVSNVVLSAGLTLVFGVRFIFALQGLAVISWWFGKYRIGCILRMLVLFLAFDLESAFFAVSILGVIDFFANFRKLKRG